MKAWAADLNTTSFRIVVSIALAAFMIVTGWTAMLFFAWVPSGTQMHLIYIFGGTVLTMMGFDVAQFVGKRFTAAEYVAAKNGGHTDGEPSRSSGQQPALN
jgi:hypothetical protein